MFSAGTGSVPYLTPQSTRKRGRRIGGDGAGDVDFSNVAAAVNAAAAATTVLRSQTRSQTRTQGHTIAGECQLSYSALHRHRIPGSLKGALAGAPVKLKIKNDSGQFTVRDGSQEFFEINSIMAVTEIDEILGDDWGASSTTARAACLGGTMEIMLTNHSSGVLRCILYAMVPKKDTITNPSATYVAGFTNMGSTAGVAETFGMRPGDSPPFNDNWHIIQAEQFCLSAGQTHIHKHTYDVEQLLEGGTELPTQVYQKKWTVNFGFLCHGVAATSSTGGDTTTTADGQLNYVWNKKLRWKFFDFDDGAAIDSAMLVPAAASVTTRMYNPDTGAVADVGTGD